MNTNSDKFQSIKNRCCFQSDDEAVRFIESALKNRQRWSVRFAMWRSRNLPLFLTGNFQEWDESGTRWPIRIKTFSLREIGGSHGFITFTVLGKGFAYVWPKERREDPLKGLL